MTKSEEELFLPAVRVRRRYGNISDMTLWRWMHKPEVGFPAPIVISGRQFWKVSDLEEWEKGAAAGKATAVTDAARIRDMAARARSGKKHLAEEA